MTTDKENRICFLLGAGASIPAGMPSTEEITETILQGKNIKKRNDTWLINETLATIRGLDLGHEKRRLLKFLQILKLYIDKYYSYWPERNTNYEDLYYVSKQIGDSEYEEVDNPAVQPLVEKIYQEINPFLKTLPGEISKKWTIGEIARESSNYIHDIAACLLFKVPAKKDHLNCLLDSYTDTEITKIYIFSLNHDLILEYVFKENKIDCIDGFGEIINDIRYWKPELLENDNSKITLLKLHGSVNLWRFNSEKDLSIGLYYGKDDVNKSKNPQNLRHSIPDSRPIMLIGTFNKMYDYANGIFFILQWHMFRLLRESNILIVSGYSFGDKGINTRIVEWVYSLEKNKIILIHPEPDFLKRNSRGAISNRWKDLLNSNKLHIIEKKIENTSWAEIKGLLFQ